MKDISLEKAILIAKEKASSFNYNTEEYKVIADKDNSSWNSYIKKGYVDLENMRDILDNRNFWAVQFVYNGTQPVLGGVIFIFIDRVTGEVICVLPFK